MDQTLNLRDEKRLDKLGLGDSLGLEYCEQRIVQLRVELAANVLPFAAHAFASCARISRTTARRREASAPLRGREFSAMKSTPSRRLIESGGSALRPYCFSWFRAGLGRVEVFPQRSQVAQVWEFRFATFEITEPSQADAGSLGDVGQRLLALGELFPCIGDQIRAHGPNHMQSFAF